MSGLDSNGHLHGAEGKYVKKVNRAPGASAGLAVDDTFDEVAHDDLHDAADAFAAQVNAGGRAAQVGFLRRMRVEDAEMRAAIAAQDAVDPDNMDSALDDLVYDTANDVASHAYNNDSGPEGVTADLENKRWMALGDYTLRTDITSPLRLGARECLDMVVRSADGTDIKVRIGYDEWVPNGDNGMPARGYRRGEFSAETEWHVNQTPAAVETSPFRPERGEESLARDYAWKRFDNNLRAELDRAAAHRKADPMREWMEG